MKNTRFLLVLLFTVALASCGQTGKTNETDNVTHSNDTMVIKQNQTDSATHSVSTDTTKR